MQTTNVTFESHKAVLLFDSDVNARSIAALVEQINAIIDDLHYKTVDLQILSPGGEISSLLYYVEAFRRWERRATINTYALTSVASASAVMLSLGHHRSAAGVTSRLLYHGARYVGSFALTSARASTMHTDLQASDDLLITALVERALRIPPPDWDQRWSHADKTTAEQFNHIRPRQSWRHYLCGDEPGITVDQKTQFLRSVYTEVLQYDTETPVPVAIRIGLLDSVGPSQPRLPVRADGIAIPEWRSIFPDGIAPTALRRHIMIFGETGSGKTASGVLPIINAMVQSRKGPADRRVACALVIDPKREIAQEIEGMGVRPTIIAPGSTILNVMSPAEPPDHVATHATAILARIASLSPSNPASFLIGKAITDNNPYWPRQGVKMATTALSLILLVLKHEKEIYGANGLLAVTPETLLTGGSPGSAAVDPQPAAAAAPTPHFRRALLTLADRAGIDDIDSVTPAALATATDGYSWTRQQEKTVERTARKLRQHGFVVQQFVGDDMGIDEIRNCAMKECDLGVFTRWTTQDGTANWHGVANPFTAQAIADSSVSTDALLSDIKPPLDTLIIDADERQNVPVYDYGTGAARELRLPGVRRDISRPNDREKMLVVADLRTQCAKRFHKNAWSRAFERKTAHKLNQLTSWAKDDAAQSGAGREYPGSVLLLIMLQDLYYGPFNTTSPYAPSGPLMPGAYYADDSGWRPQWANAYRPTAEYYYAHEDWYTAHLIASQFGWPDEYGPLPGPAEPDEPYGQDDEYLADYPVEADLELEDEGDPGPVKYDPNWGRWRVPKDWTEAEMRVCRAIALAREQALVLDRYGVWLSRMALGCGAREGEREWGRRLDQKVQERNECVAELADLGQALRVRVRDVPMDHRRKWWHACSTQFLHHDAESLATLEFNWASFSLIYLPGLDDQMPAAFGLYRYHLDQVLEAGRIRLGGSGRGNVIALAARVLDTTFGIANVSQWGVVLDRLKERVAGREQRREIDDVRIDVDSWARLGDGSETQYMGVHGSALDCVFDFSQPAVAETLYFGCEPYWRAQKDNANAIRFEEHLNRPDGQSIFVLQPDLHGTDLIARALKAVFFETVLRDRKRQQRGHRKPLVGYVADEFHRFITADRVHGEQSFLDTCRSFGVFCVLACQSSASMKYVLHDMESGTEKVHNAVSIILNNTGTKLFFRTTDVGTKGWLSELAPTKPGAANVVDVRPPSTLAAGECYAVVVDGRFLRAQLKQWKPHRKRREMSAAEKKAVSERMTAYWAERRKKAAKK